MITRALKYLIYKLPYLNKLEKELKQYKTKYPPGHYYSPVPSIEEITKNEKEIFNIKKKEIDGIDLNEKEQIELLEQCKQLYNEILFEYNKKDGLRYCLNNGNYFDSDAIFLFITIRYFKPDKIIELGCGYSSALMLDINERFFNNKINLTFIDPYPERLFSLITEHDKINNTIYINKVQEVGNEIFR